MGDAAVAAEQFERDAETLQHRDVGRRRIELLLRAKQLQGALHALVVGDPGIATELAQAVAAVLGQPQHPALVDVVARRGAVAQHPEAPANQLAIEPGPDHQRAMPHQQPADRLQRHAGAGPRRRIAGRHLAGIGKARLEPGRRLALDDRDLVAGARQLIGGRDADDAAAQNQHPHGHPRCRDARQCMRRRRDSSTRHRRE